MSEQGMKQEMTESGSPSPLFLPDDKSACSQIYYFLQRQRDG